MARAIIPIIKAVVRNEPSEAVLSNKLFTPLTADGGEINWQEKDSWNIPAVYFADEKALVFDLNAAYAPTKKGGWSARRESEAAAAEAALNMTVEE